MIRLALAAVALVVAAEAGLRVLGLGAPLLYEPHAQLGWRLRPHASGVYSREGRAEVRINPAGQRDSERLLDKPDGVYRIAVLGDSYSEALQVDVQDTWWRGLPGRLAACGFGRVEVLNFAVAGYGTAQQYVMLETTAIRYQPDLVLLQFSSADDVQNNSFALAEEKERPFFLLDAAGRLRVDDSFASGPGFRRHASFTHDLGRRLADRSRLLQLALETPFIPRAHANDYQPALLEAPRERLWEEAWKVTEALLVKTSAFAARNGAKFALVVAPHPVQLGSRDLTYPERRLAAFGASRGIPVIALAEGLGSVPDTIYYERHWNRAGHRAVAEIVSQGLCKARSLQGTGA